MTYSPALDETACASSFICVREVYPVESDVLVWVMYRASINLVGEMKQTHRGKQTSYLFLMMRPCREYELRRYATVDNARWLVFEMSYAHRCWPFFCDPNGENLKQEEERRSWVRALVRFNQSCELPTSPCDPIIRALLIKNRKPNATYSVAAG